MCGALVTMKRRPAFDGSNQERALRGLLAWSRRALRTRSGKTLKDLAVELSVSPATLARYLNGTTPLGSEQFAPFAHAFETTEAALIAACFPVMALNADVDGDPSWDFLAELTRVWRPELGDMTPTYEALRSADQPTQRAVIAAILDSAQHERSLAAPGQQPRPPSGERAEYRYGRTG